MRKLSIYILALLNAVPALAFGCPLIDGLVDTNCDGILKIAFTGDSFVKGTGDKSDLGGGYVSRVAQFFPNAVVTKFPQPGVASGILYSRLVRHLPSSLRGTDYLHIDIGRNDYYEDNNPANTVTNLRRMVAFIKKELSKRGGTTPIIAVSTLAPTNRAFQGPFIQAVNSLLLAQKSSKLPVFLRMDEIRNSLISRDGLHPTGLGYEAMALIIRTYMETRAQSRVRSVCIDADGDGIYDKFELSRFGTNPDLPDTDSDTYGDGDEVFAFATDPLDAVSHP